MGLISLIYYSDRLTDSEEEVKSILETSVRNNDGYNITGLLLYTDSNFIQYLEGNDELVKVLYTKIEQDTRHHNVTLIKREEIEERIFPKWAMGSKKLGDNTIEFDHHLNSYEKTLFTALIHGAVSKSEAFSQLINKLLLQSSQ